MSQHINPTPKQTDITSLNSNLFKVGTITEGTNNNIFVSVADGTGVELDSVTVDEPGTYLLIGAADWAANGNGYRQVAFAADINPGRYHATTTTAINGKELYQQIMHVVTPTGRSTYKIYGRQTSGGAINCYPYLIAIRI